MGGLPFAANLLSPTESKVGKAQREFTHGDQLLLWYLNMYQVLTFCKMFNYKQLAPIALGYQLEKAQLNKSQVNFCSNTYRVMCYDFSDSLNQTLVDRSLP